MGWLRSRCHSSFVCMLLAAGVLTSAPASAQSAEIEALKARVAELEDQNRRMAKLLEAIQARIGLNSENSVSVPVAAATAVEAAPAAAVLPSSAPASQPGAVQSHTAAPDTDAPHLRFYGMLRLDMDIDTQRPNSPQTPLFITSPSTGKGGSFAMHPRLTRFGLDVTGPHVDGLGGAELSGKLETDFENGGSESRQIIRIRHAYVKSTWKDFSLLAGQTWDVFSPLFPTVNNDTLMWNAGNLGDRRPQFRAAYEPRVGKGRLSFANAIGLTGAVDPLDLDANGYADGVQSMRPNVQSRLGYSRPLWVPKQEFALGGSLFYGWLETARPIGGRTILPAQAFNADITLPLTAFLGFRGEGWWGRNMSDIRGGAGQSLTLSTGRIVRGRGGWGEIKVRINRYWSLAPGFTTDNPVKADLAAGNRTRNRAFYIGNRITTGGPLDFGIDYLRWRTDYFGAASGFDNRINIFVQYGF